MNRDIIERYLARAPSPACAYLYDLDHLRARAMRLVAPLPERCELFYAVKANSDAPVLAALRGTVAGFEVASLGEIERVREAAGDARIVFGGPGKTDRELRGALEHGVELIHVESELQLRRLDAIAREAGRPARVLLRLNPLPFGREGAAPRATGTLTMGGQATQFGIDERQAPALIALAAALPGIRLAGLHLHALSNNLDARSHLALIDHYLGIAAALRDSHGLVLEILNVGGGIGIDYADPAREFDWTGFCDGLHGLLAQQRVDCRIVFECGRFISADCGCYVAEVIDLKRNHGRDFAVLRGGTHHFRLPASWQHDHPFQVVPNDAWPYAFARPELRDGRISLCGELCTPKDVFAREVHVERLRVGDRVVFRLAGAYGWHISHHDFLSHPHPERIFFGGEPA
ncbi:type III PLP-dependent enzyme [Burkholderia sp. Cy-647]|uniref:type III PLP-dependent enzyme n=1 Tax=unclassified Burkholderia TaxID=2613784 RepID=UPI00142296FD|nr:MULTISPECIES: type III PLP-dependent enzyme [unclassified Burkholderia]NIF66595.1 type III PLP-dependent enzyme [Burkholderia sp. Cy-647]NIF74763.1 type III PLP-dependent enzyme [Burkholderia sp. Ap-962]NIF93327.1 type III PLP-dependent enzyme [Burkholderia sp. Cy-637]NIG00464.1 type III PLP-dependent enzyme [Burkholderia sp. Ax-1720]